MGGGLYPSGAIRPFGPDPVPGPGSRSIAPGIGNRRAWGIHWPGMEIQIVRGELLAQKVDAIVNPCNNDLILGADVSREIRRQGGEKIQEECNRLAPIPLGHAVATSAGNLPFQWLFHAAIMPLGLWADSRSIRAAIANVLRIAEEKGIGSLAFPHFGGGASNVAAPRVARILFEELAKHLPNSRIRRVVVVLSEENDYADYLEAFEGFRPRFS